MKTLWVFIVLFLQLFCVLVQRFPTCLAPRTSFVEDNFSTDGVGGDGSGGNVTGTSWQPGGWGPLF